VGGRDRSSGSSSGSTPRSAAVQRASPAEVAVDRWWRRRVAVPDARLRQRGGRSGARAVVCGGEVALQQVDRPAVARDVVDEQLQQVLLGPQPHEQGAQQRPAGQVERLGRRGVEHRPRGRPAVGVLLPQRHPDLGHDLDRRSPVRVGREPHPQRLVPARQGVQRAAQRVPVDRAAQAQRDRDVVGGGARRELLHEPHALLLERQRWRGAGGTGDHGRWGGPPAAAQPLFQQPPPRGHRASAVSGGAGLGMVVIGYRPR
jgi:hypothetical protein